MEIKGIYETYQKDIDKHLNELFEGIGTVPDLSDPVHDFSDLVHGFSAQDPVWYVPAHALSV